VINRGSEVFALAFVPSNRLVLGKNLLATEVEGIFHDPTLQDRVLHRNILVYYGHPNGSDLRMSDAALSVFLLQPRIDLIDAAIHLVEAEEEGEEVGSLYGIEIGLVTRDSEAGRLVAERLHDGDKAHLMFNFNFDPVTFCYRLRNVYFDFYPCLEKSS